MHGVQDERPILANKVNPVTVVTDATRGLMIGGPVAKPLLESAAWLTAITVTSWR